ncbi:hypothetical protein H0O00_00595 [Candidatus Micrarchaeota archaeon]|nr:hypothetical protein [Candidatus Micrarchaeota archaeon]
MAPVDVVAFSLLFPMAAALTGVYLILRGAGRFTKSRHSIICGKVKYKKTVKSLATGRDCAFFYTLIESYSRGRWHPIYFIKQETSFMLGSRPVEEGVAYLNLSKPTIIHGTIPHEKKLVEKSMESLQNSIAYRPVSAALSILGRNEPVYQPLDISIMGRLQSNPRIKAVLKHHNARLLRITEHVLSEGMEICAIAEAGDTGPIKGTTEFPLILSDMKPEDAVDSLKERSLLSIFSGGALLIISALLLASLIFQV